MTVREMALSVSPSMEDGLALGQEMVLSESSRVVCGRAAMMTEGGGDAWSSQ